MYVCLFRVMCGGGNLNVYHNVLCFFSVKEAKSSNLHLASLVGYDQSRRSRNDKSIKVGTITLNDFILAIFPLSSS